MGRRSLAVLLICFAVVAAGSAAAQTLDEFIRAKAYCIRSTDEGKTWSGLIEVDQPTWVNAKRGDAPGSLGWRGRPTSARSSTRSHLRSGRSCSTGPRNGPRALAMRLAGSWRRSKAAVDAPDGSASLTRRGNSVNESST